MDNLDCDNLETNMLTPEQMRETSDSRTRLKAVHKGEMSRSISTTFRLRSPEPEGLRTLETLAKAASDWRLLKKQLNLEKGAEIHRNFTDRNPLLASTLRNDLNQGTPRLRVEGEKQTSCIKPTSNLEYDVFHNPNKDIAQEIGKTIIQILQGQNFKDHREYNYYREGEGHQEKSCFYKTKIYVS